MTKTFVIFQLMPAQTKRPTKLELEILRVLWESGPQSVRKIQQRLEAKSKPTGYTTVLKMVQIMNTKGLVERDETSGLRSTALDIRSSTRSGNSFVI